VTFTNTQSGKNTTRYISNLKSKSYWKGTSITSRIQHIVKIDLSIK